MLNIFLFPFHRFVIQFIQFWSPILFIYAPVPIQGLMYFLLCCFSVMQCQLSLFKGGYLKGRRDKACTQLHRYSVWPAGSAKKKKTKKTPEEEEGERKEKKKKQPCEKSCLTMATEEMHNANSFPNTTDWFPHKAEKAAAFS